jgi:hypothetical protein
MYSSFSFSTSALDEGECQLHAPAALYPRGKRPRYPLYWRLGGPQSRSRHRGYRKNPLYLRQRSNLDRPVVQSVARHYIDWATPAPQNLLGSLCNYSKAFTGQFSLCVHTERNTFSSVLCILKNEIKSRYEIWNYNTIAYNIGCFFNFCM